MTANDFCYWLNGFFELGGNNVLDENQVKIIKEHLSLVFNKVTQYTYPLPSPVKPYISEPFYDKIICSTAVQASC